jgi:branched-chain amino acid transport system permease protein
MIVALVLTAIWPWVVPFSVVGSSLEWIQLALVAASLVILTGWVGQISLAQATFVGIAALVTGMASRGWGLSFPATTVIGAAAAGLAAVLLGVVALRVRGLYLAVATLIFAWMGYTYLFRTTWLGANSGSSAIPPQHNGTAGGLPFIDLTDRRTLFYLFAAVLALVLFALANLRNTKTGRAFFAVRGSEMAAASLGIDVVRTKLVAFAISGFVAGIAGNILMVRLGVVEPDQFLFTVSLQYLAIAVVGGLGSLGGAVAAGALFAGLDELFFRVTALAGWLDIVSAGLLALVLLAYPGSQRSWTPSTA